MGATMVKNGNLLDALPSQVIVNNIKWFSNSVHIIINLIIVGNSTRRNARLGFCWQNNSAL